MDNIECKRKAFHIGAGFTIIAAIYFNILTPLRLFVIILSGIPLCYALRKHTIQPFTWLAKQFEREKSLKSLPGKSVLFFLTGALITITLFEKDIAIAGILILTLGDALSPLFGINYGKIKHPFSNKKYIEGSIIGFLAAFIGIMLFTVWGYINITPIEAFVSAFIAMLIEGIEIKLHRELHDDNIIIPIVAGLVIWVMRIL